MSCGSGEAGSKTVAQGGLCPTAHALNYIICVNSPPVELIDNIVGSKWTLTVCGRLQNTRQGHCLSI